MRMPRGLRVPAIAALVLAAIGTGRAQAPAHSPARSDQPVPFAVGETLVYDVSWSSFVTAGEATLVVRERTRTPEGGTYHIVADGRPSGLVAQLFTLYYKVETWLDARNLLPRRASTYSEEGRRRRTKVTTFDQRAHKARFENGSSRRDVIVPPLAQDPLSALYVLRALRLASGQQLSMPVMNDGELHRVTLTVGRREEVECGLGTLQALRIGMTATDADGRPVGRDMALWLTTGRRQVPVQITAGLPVGSYRLLLREARGIGQ